MLAVVSSWDPVIVCAFALGAGYGAFQSVSQALSMIVLPDQASAARDLGIINIASVDSPGHRRRPWPPWWSRTGAGYRGLFVFAGLLALAAAAVFSRVPRAS